MLRRSSILTVLLLAVYGIGAGEQPPLPPGSGADETQLIERIRAERDPGRRILTESPSAHQAYERLQSIYLDRGSYAQALEVGQQMMDSYPADIDVAVNCLRAAQALKIVELVRRYAIESWKRASWMASKTAPEAEFARAVMSDAEFVLSSLAHDRDPQTRESAARSLARLNPRSAFLMKPAISGTAARWSGPATGDHEDIPDEAGQLLGAANSDLQRGQRLAGVLEKCLRVLELVGDEAGSGNPQRDRYRAAAHWMSGVAASFLGRYALADEHLRTVLPEIRNHPDALSIALYHLGYANYWLAEMGERARIRDAFRFNRECAAMRGPYRQLAERTLASIKSQYNMR